MLLLDKLTSFCNENFPPFVSENLYWKRKRIIKDLLEIVLKKQIISGNDLDILYTKLSDFFEPSKIVLTGSGRHSLSIFLKVVKKRLPDRRIILLPFYICSSVVRTIEELNFQIRYVNVKSDLNIDPQEITSESLKGVAAVIVPHIYGWPADIKLIYDKVKAIDKKISVIDDAAAAFNIKIGNKLLGTFADAGVISFSQGKLLNASGGGLLIINNPLYLDEIYQEYTKIPLSCSYDKLRDLLYVVWNFGLNRYSSSISYWVDRKNVGRKYLIKAHDKKLTNIDAAILNRLLNEIDEIHNKIFRIQRYYIAAFRRSKLPFSFPQSDKNPRTLITSKLCCGYQCSDSKMSAQIIHELKFFLEKNGIKLSTAYAPASDQSEGYYKLWDSNSWIKNLLILPVNYKKNVIWHGHVVSMIYEYFSRKLYNNKV